MQNAPLGHMQFNVDADNLPFYRDLLTFLEWRLLGEWPGMIGLGSESGQSLWFSGQVKDVSNDYDGPGLNPVSYTHLDVYKRQHQGCAVCQCGCHLCAARR